MPARRLADEQGASLRELGVITGLVVLAHAGVLAAFLIESEPPTVQVNEMSVSFASAQAQAQAAPQPQAPPKPRQDPPVQTPQAPEIAPEIAPEAAPAAAAAPSAPDTAPPAPAVADAEPDYKADYLDNPRPPYPMVARRMGYHGKVVLDVEVLADGRAGDVKLRESSGYDILDNAAVQTVKTWRFTPARRLGQPVTQRFLVPIKFSLEDSKA